MLSTIKSNLPSIQYLDFLTQTILSITLNHFKIQDDQNVSTDHSLLPLLWAEPVEGGHHP